MTRELTTSQFDNLSRNDTRPVYVVQLGFSGDVEYLSVSGDIVFDGNPYIAGGVDDVVVSDGRSGSLKLIATPERVADLDSGSWRNQQICKIFHIPGIPNDDGIYTADEGILVLDGYIDTVSMSKGSIRVAATHKYLNGNFSPRINFNELSVVAPAPGTVIEMNGEKYILTSRR